MNLTLDPNLFTQIGLDSGSLTMLGTVVHQFAQPGEYRGVVHKGEEVKAVFIVSSDKNSPNAQVTIDLNSLVPGPAPSHPDGCTCCDESSSSDQGPRRFVVNPRGYVLFHVSGGAGGYYVHARRMDAPQDDKGYDSRRMTEGDVFTAIVIRPGTYSVVNRLTGGKAELIVSYPKREEKGYRPPAPLRVSSGERSFEPARIQTQPGQGVIFESRTASHIQITLEKADDGPKQKGPVRPSGFLSNKLR